MKKLLAFPYLFAVVILLVATGLSAKIMSIQTPLLMAFAAAALLICLNISSILFYLSLNVENKIIRFIFSAVNLLLFLFVGLFAIESIGHMVIR